MAQPEPQSREFRQMRHDVDDVYALLDSMAKSVVTVSATQRRHGNRLEEIQQSLDLQNGRLDRVEDNQRRQGDRLGGVADAQREQGERLGGVADAQREQGERLGRIEDTQQEILTLLRGRPG